MSSLAAVAKVLQWQSWMQVGKGQSPSMSTPTIAAWVNRYSTKLYSGNVIRSRLNQLEKSGLIVMTKKGRPNSYAWAEARQVWVTWKEGIETANNILQSQVEALLGDMNLSTRVKVVDLRGRGKHIQLGESYGMPDYQILLLLKLARRGHQAMIERGEKVEKV